MERQTRFRFAVAIGAIAVAIVAGLLLWNRGDGHVQTGLPSTVKRLTHLLNQADPCQSVKTEFSRLPVKPDGPPGTAFKRFGEAPSSAGLVGCEVLSGFIGYYRFPSHDALIGAVRRHPKLPRHETYCDRDDELIIDTIAGYDPTPKICKKLRFPIHRAQG